MQRQQNERMKMLGRVLALCLLELIFVLVSQGLGNGDGFQNIDQADNNSDSELLAEFLHCTTR